MLDITCIEYRRNVPKQIHCFPVSSLGCNDFRAKNQYGAFLKAMTERASKDSMSKRFFPFRKNDKKQENFLRCLYAKLGIEFDTLPQIQHKDLRSFCKAVGYDYKTKQFAPVY